MINDNLINEIMFWVDKGTSKKPLITACLGAGFSKREVVDHIEHLLSKEILVQDVKNDWIVVKAWMPRTAAEILERNKGEENG